MVKDGIKHQEKVTNNNLRIMDTHLLRKIIKKENKQKGKEEGPKLIYKGLTMRVFYQELQIHLRKQMLTKNHFTERKPVNNSILLHFYKVKKWVDSLNIYSIIYL